MRRRGSNGFSLNPWTWEAFDAFQRNAGLRLAPWEVEILERLDDLFMADQAARAGATTNEPDGE